jgi:hypothetical protein
MESVAKSYMRKGFLIYEEMRKYLTIYEEAVSHIWLCNCSILNFLVYEENLIFFFKSTDVLENWVVVREKDVSPPTPPFSTVQQAFGQIYEDDLSGFPSSSDICFMAFTSSAKRIFHKKTFMYFPKVAPSIQHFFYLFSYWLVRRLSRWAPIKVMRKIAAKSSYIRYCHRVDRALGFFSSRPNWDPPTPSPLGECVPYLWFRGGHACGRVSGGSQFERGISYFLGIAYLCNP